MKKAGILAFLLLLSLSLGSAAIDDAVAHWKLDETESDIKVDNSGTGDSALDGTSVNGVPVVVLGDGRSEIARAFLGSLDTNIYMSNPGNYIKVSDNNNLDIETGDFTISFWAHGPFRQNAKLLSKGDVDNLVDTKGYGIWSPGDSHLALV